MIDTDSVREAFKWDPRPLFRTEFDWKRIQKELMPVCEELFLFYHAFVQMMDSNPTFYGAGRIFRNAPVYNTENPSYYMFFDIRNRDYMDSHLVEKWM